MPALLVFPRQVHAFLRDLPADILWQAGSDELADLLAEGPHLDGLRAIPDVQNHVLPQRAAAPAACLNEFSGVG
jgi:hypothetical protein